MHHHIFIEERKKRRSPHLGDGVDGEEEAEAQAALLACGALEDGVHGQPHAAAGQDGRGPAPLRGHLHQGHLGRQVLRDALQHQLRLLQSGGGGDSCLICLIPDTSELLSLEGRLQHAAILVNSWTCRRFSYLALS